MALAASKARPVEREIKIPSGVKGFPDRVFLVGLGSKGLTLREKGKREERFVSFTNFARWMIMHAPSRETSSTT